MSLGEWKKNKVEGLEEMSFLVDKMGELKVENMILLEMKLWNTWSMWLSEWRREESNDDSMLEARDSISWFSFIWSFHEELDKC